MLKALITDHLLDPSNETAKYCVISDIDIEPMSSEQIFDIRTLGYLSTFGYVFNRLGQIGIENSFLIFNREKENLKNIHKQTMIVEMEKMITKQRNYNFEVTNHSEYSLGSQCVFGRYTHFTSEMNESHEFNYYFVNPRKVVKCPRSQFNNPFQKKAISKKNSAFLELTKFLTHEMDGIMGMGNHRLYH